MSESVALDGTTIQWGSCRGCAVSIPLAPPVIWTDGRPLCFRCQDGQRSVDDAVAWLRARLKCIGQEAESIRLQLAYYESCTTLEEGE